MPSSRGYRALPDRPADTFKKVARDMPEIDDWIHPLDLLARRDPLTTAGVRVLVLAQGDDGSAASVGRGLVKLLEQRQRPADFVVHSFNASISEAITSATSDTAHQLILITTTRQAWSFAHLDPLLKAIDTKDHVVGRRPLPLWGRLKRWGRHLPARLLFASPILDPHSPCRIHRRDALMALDLQSHTAFVDVEWVAKATFLKQLIDEIPVPTMGGIEDDRAVGADFRAVWSQPRFKPLRTI